MYAVLSAYSADLRNEVELNLKMLAGQNLSSIYLRMKNDLILNKKNTFH